MEFINPMVVQTSYSSSRVLDIKVKFQGTTKLILKILPLPPNTYFNLPV